MNVRPRTVSNCAGFFENDTSFMLLDVVPASKRPGFRLLRGSVVLGYVCDDRRLAECREGTPAHSSSGVEKPTLRFRNLPAKRASRFNPVADRRLEVSRSEERRVGKECRSR